MPHVPLVVSDEAHDGAIRVLISGFGPFAHYTQNPSWLAVRPLHNVLLQSAVPSQPVTLEHKKVLSDVVDARPIYITTAYVPVSYAAVLSIVPKLYGRPPSLPPPPSDDNQLSTFPTGPDPPADGYDLIIHVGAGQRGNLRIEKLGHKYGYDMPDVNNKYAPIVKEEDEDGEGKRDVAETFERARLAGGRKKDSAVRGFAAGYEAFPEELSTIIDVDALVKELQDSGVDYVQASTNAGRYLCDFTYYCSLAEAQRTRHNGDRKATKVLFVHCPPVGEPLSTELVTEALRRIVASVCSQPS